MHRHVLLMMTSGLSGASVASFLESGLDRSGAGPSKTAATRRARGVAKPGENRAEPEFVAGMNRQLAMTKAG